MEPVIILIPYIIGTLIGLHFGFKSGVRLGSENTIDALMQKGFLKYKETAEGIIEFIKVK
jgi:hypothetical protein|tara:strand:- start:6107 stop:6286 length:180 start_codon:yes stop_codon:yes gene_type:complete